MKTTQTSLPIRFLEATGQMPYLVPADRICPHPFDDLLAGKERGCFPLRKVPDVFHPEFISRCQGWFSGLSRFREDSWLLGYFVDNEELWCLWQSPFALPLAWVSRRTFVDELKARYHDIATLNRAWSPAF